MHPVRVFSYLQKKIRLFVNLSVNISALWIEGFRLLHDLLDNSGTQQHSCQDKSLEVLQNTSWGKGYYYDIQTKLHQSFFFFAIFFLSTTCSKNLDLVLAEKHLVDHKYPPLGRMILFNPSSCFCARNWLNFQPNDKCTYIPLPMLTFLI